MSSGVLIPLGNVSDSRPVGESAAPRYFTYCCGFASNFALHAVEQK